MSAFCQHSIHTNTNNMVTLSAASFSCLCFFTAYLTELDLPQEELDSSIIGAIGDMDGPMPADTKGWASLRRHLMGHTDETRQRFRDEVRESFEHPPRTG